MHAGAKLGTSSVEYRLGNRPKSARGPTRLGPRSESRALAQLGSGHIAGVDQLHLDPSPWHESILPRDHRFSYTAYVAIRCRNTPHMTAKRQSPAKVGQGQSGVRRVGGRAILNSGDRSAPHGS